MELDKLRFVIDKIGDISKNNEINLLKAYKELFKEIYGYDILSKYEKEKSKIKKSDVFDDAFIKSIDVLKSVKEDDNLSLLMVYDDNNNILGFGRIRKLNEVKESNSIFSAFNSLLEKHLNITNERKVSIPDIAIVPEYSEYKYDIWKKSVSFIENIVTIQGYDRLYIEIPVNSPLLFRADDLGFIEDPADIPISYMPRTRILNKTLERSMDAEFNFNR